MGVYENSDPSFSCQNKDDSILKVCFGSRDPGFRTIMGLDPSGLQLP